MEQSKSSSKELFLLAALMPKETLLSILKEEIETWETATDSETKEKSWQRIGFSAALVISKTHAPTFEQAIEAGHELDQFSKLREDVTSNDYPEPHLN